MIRQLSLGLALKDDATFDNFTAGDNQILLNQLQQAFTQRDERFFYLWSASGCGKTHLLQACCHQATQLRQTASFLALADFQQYSPEVLMGLETLDCVVLDDIEKIAGNDAWQEAIFHLYNRMRAAEGLLIVSGNVAPTQLAITLPDLTSRLAWGLVFQVKALSDQDKSLALIQRANLRGMEMSPQVANYLLTRCSRDMKQLLALLDTLDRVSLAEQRRLTIPFVREVIHH